MGFFLSCPLLAYVGQCFCIDHTGCGGGAGVSSVDSRGSSGTSSRVTSSSRGIKGRALFALLPFNGLGMCILTNTGTEARGGAGGGGSASLDFCHQVCTASWMHDGPHGYCPTTPLT